MKDKSFGKSVLERIAGMSVTDEIAEGPLPVREDGTLDSGKLNYVLQRQAKKRDFVVIVKYFEDEKKYEFKIYGVKK